MAIFKPYRVLDSKLSSLPIKEGQLVLVTDTKKLYFDISDNQRILVSADAIVNFSVSNTTVTYTRADGTTGSFDTKDTTYNLATSTTDGLMSGSDKEKIDTIEKGAQVNTVTGVKGNSETSYRTGNINITKANIGLGNVENKSSETIRGEITSSNVTTALGYTPINNALKGAANGVAELDANGKVPSSQLPSYVDDVLEYASKDKFPTTGETGKIYVATDTNLTYRWGGSEYVEISASLALGTTSSTAFRGDYGQTAYEHATDSSKLSTATASGLYKVAATDKGHIASLTKVTKADITDLGIPGSDTNTTYTLSADTTNKVIKLTPSSGDAQTITVPYATNATNDSDGNAINITYYKASNPNGYTSNTGTITGVSANGTSVATSGVANIPAASTSKYGVTKLSTSTSSTSTSLAATPSAVKAAYDLANGKLSSSDITITQGLTSGATVGTIKIGSGDVITLYAPNPGNISTKLATAQKTYYLTGVTETTASDGAQVYNTRISDTYSGIKYKTSTSAQGGSLYVDDREVTLGLYYAIA